MAENVPPVTTAGPNGTATPSAPAGVSAEQMQSRGIPYYEKLRRELRDTLHRKRMMDKNMAALEESIYRFEQSYLEETGAGNIIKGFDNYIKGASGGSGIGAGGALGSMAGGGAGGPATRRKTAVQDSDRVFSRSSASFMRDSPAPSSANTTPSHAPTPTSTMPSGPNNPGSNKDKDANNVSAASSVKGSTNKKKKASGANAESNRRERDEDDDAESGSGNKQPVKRLKITYGRD
ncbi:hypothetical protein AJ79_02225 [Helicocarpus griseus UAMH5409]|uniref:Chromatin modification-related protein EAF6 n=1 Tax=Helicocarpus griseus UAMH5409 TaxID=1447875 RepID=A0A2B7Y460_9EURO|nr:hypothetical protein AJ79_02225 [Helicocarpus griseus UAMH5409]